MAPELLQTIRLAWQKALISDAELRSLTKRITEGKATYKEVEDVAYRVGKDLSKALVGNITSDIMPNGHVPQNVAEKILQPTLREAHAMVIEAATKTQEAMNKAAGIGLKAQAAEFDAEKAQGLVYKLTNGLLEDTGWILDAPVTSFVQSSADRTMKKNVDFQARAGLHPRITRKAEGKCCKWCSNLEGSYDYGDEPQDIYKRHRNCRCVVDYRPGDGKRQNVWSKEWHEDANPEEIKRRMTREKELAEERKKVEKERKSRVNLPETIKLPDELVRKSVGAKSKNYDIMDLATGEVYHLVEGEYFRDREIFAGKGVKTPYRKAGYYAEKYGGKPEDWKHAKGIGLLDTKDGYHWAEIHWSECEGIGAVEHFVKEWLD